MYSGDTSESIYFNGIGKITTKTNTFPPETEKQKQARLESEKKKDLKKETLKIMILYPIYCLIIAIFSYYGITFLFGIKSASLIVVIMVGIFSTIIVLDLNFKIKAIYYLIYEYLEEKEKITQKKSLRN